MSDTGPEEDGGAVAAPTRMLAAAPTASAATTATRRTHDTRDGRGVAIAGRPPARTPPRSPYTLWAAGARTSDPFGPGTRK